MPGIRRHQLDERGMLHIDSRGREVIRVPAELFGGNGAVAEIEITRGDLNQVLLDAVAEEIARPGGPGADYMSTPAGIEPHWMTMQLLPGGTALGFRPDADPATTKAIITMRRDADPALRHDTEAQRELVRRRLTGGRLAPLVCEAMDRAQDFYFDELARITMPSWTTERIALVGDAGYCGSPLSGQGTAMALVGAYILVGELARTPDRPAEALNRYTRILRPFVEIAQELPPGGVKGITPRTRPGIAAARTLLRIATSRMMQPLMTRMVSQTENYVLPDYPAGHTAAAG